MSTAFWTMTDANTGVPIYAGTALNLAPTRANANVIFANANVAQAFSEAVGVYGVDTQEASNTQVTPAATKMANADRSPWGEIATPDEASKQIINVGGTEEHSINQAASILCEVIGSGKVFHLESRHEVKYSIPTWQKSVNILKFEHKTNLKNGLTEMWNWAKLQPKREQFIWPSYELEKGIYSFWK